MIFRLVVVLLVLGSGCARPDHDASRALANADTFAVHGHYPAAMAAYEAYLARFPANGEADRVRASRTLVAELMAARAERDRLVVRAAELTQQLGAREAEMTRQAQATRQLDEREAERQREFTAREAELTSQAVAREAELTSQAAAREAELARLRQELTARQAEVARLREDLEALKRTDLQMERRGR